MNKVKETTCIQPENKGAPHVTPILRTVVDEGCTVRVAFKIPPAASELVLAIEGDGVHNVLGSLQLLLDKHARVLQPELILHE